jgi:hypothetical protein
MAQEAGHQGAWQAPAQAEPPSAWQGAPQAAGHAAWRTEQPPAQHAAPYDAGQVDPWAGQPRRSVGAIRSAASAPGLDPGPQASNPAMPRWTEPDRADVIAARMDTAEIDLGDLDTADLSPHPVNRSSMEISERRAGWPQAEYGEIGDTPESRARQSASRRYG